MSDTLAIFIAAAFVLNSIVSYFFGRRGAFEAGFDSGWKVCEKFMVKEILKKDGPEVQGLEE